MHNPILVARANALPRVHIFSMMAPGDAPLTIFATPVVSARKAAIQFRRRFSRENFPIRFQTIH